MPLSPKGPRKRQMDVFRVKLHFTWRKFAAKFLCVNTVSEYDILWPIDPCINGWWRRSTSIWKSGRNDPPPSADFRSIFARSASAVTPSEKSSVDTNRKSITSFPMGRIWTVYVASQAPPPKVKLKTQNDHFLYKIWKIICDNFDTIRDRMSVLITNRKSHVLSIGADIGDYEWPWTT